jgi:hypothetical protein
MASQIYQIKVTLEHSKPPIWRRILVPGDVTLAKLHYILQAVWVGGEFDPEAFDLDGVNETLRDL